MFICAECGTEYTEDQSPYTVSITEVYTVEELIELGIESDFEVLVCPNCLSAEVDSQG